MRKFALLVGGMLKWLVGLIFLVGVVAYLAGVFDEKIEPRSVEATIRTTGGGVSTVRPERVSEARIEEIPGTIAAKHETKISSRILGRIESILVRAGDRVESGSPLVILDSRELESRERQAVEALSAAQAQLVEAEAEYERAQNLFAEGTIPKSRFDSAESAYRVGLATVERSKQTLEEARISQTYARILSPIGGRVIDRLAEPGDTASPGAPLLTLYDPSDLRLEAYVRESFAAGIRPGDRFEVRAEALGETFEGTVEEVVPRADPGSRSLLVKVSLPDAEGVYPGMFGRLLIPDGTTESVYLPEGVIRTVGQLNFVTLKKGEGVSENRMIRVGESRREGQVSILSGIAPGEEVEVLIDQPRTGG